MDHPAMTLFDASRLTDISPIDIYNHLTRMRHTNRPILSQPEYSVILEQSKNPNNSAFSIAKKIGVKGAEVRNILLKHGMSTDLIAQNDEITRIKDVIAKLYIEDPYFPEKEIYNFVGRNTRPKNIRIALEQFKKERKKDLAIAKQRPEVSHRMATHARRKAIMTYINRHPNATYDQIAKKFKVSPQTISQDISEVSAQLRVQYSQSYELQRRRISCDLEKIKNIAIERFESSPRASTRLLEIYLSAIDKEIGLHGLNAPKRQEVSVSVTENTKEERDAVVDAFYTTVGEALPQNQAMIEHNQEQVYDANADV